MTPEESHLGYFSPFQKTWEMKRRKATENSAMKRMIAVALLFSGFAVAKNKDKNPADYPLNAHVISSNRGGTDAGSVTYGNGTASTVDSSGESTVHFRIGDLLYIGGWGCRRHVQVGTNVHARVEKNKLYILTDDGETCVTHLRGVQEIPKQTN